jgi:hypothetical protein
VACVLLVEHEVLHDSRASLKPYKYEREKSPYCPIDLATKGKQLTHQSINKYMIVKEYLVYLKIQQS